MTAAALPLWLAAFGIVLRGSGFAFRKEVETLAWQRLFGACFAFSSLIVPFFMGTVIGAIASGRVPAGLARTDLAVWTGPTSLLIGALFVAVCAYLAAVFLTREASRREDQRLRRYFALRAGVAGAVAGALALATLVEIRSANPALSHGLTHQGLALVIISAACGLAVIVLLATGRRPQALRPLSVLGVAAVVWGWGVAQYPALLPGTGLTLTSAAAPHSILVTVVAVFVAAAVLVGPSFLLLFSLHGRQLLEGESHAEEG
jgi:cytochrome d ubiquinol oxidase subunit II